jgi:hypothetical protein
MSLDTVTPKGMLIDSYNCLSQVLIAPAGSEAIQCNFHGDAGGQPDRATGRSRLQVLFSLWRGGGPDAGASQDRMGDARVAG